MRGNINGQALVCDGYFNSAFRTLASRAPANAIRFRATDVAPVRYAGVTVNGPAPAPTGGLYTSCCAN